jgi:hypothetical protein
MRFTIEDRVRTGGCQILLNFLSESFSEGFCRDAEELEAPQTNDELVKLVANLQNGLATVILSTTIIISPDPN